MRRHRIRRRGYARAPSGTYESISSGRKVFVRNTIGNEVYFRSHEGWNGNMPKESFKRHYRRVK